MKKLFCCFVLLLTVVLLASACGREPRQMAGALLRAAGSEVIRDA